MPEKELRKALAKLSEEQKNLDPADTEKRDMIEQLIEQIEYKLNEPENKEHYEGLLAKLKERIVYFEAEHPIVATILEDIKMFLVKMGA